MSVFDRRDFLKTGAAAAAVAFQSRTVLGANDRVRIAVIGLRGRGMDHIRSIGGIPNVELAAVCDVDENVMKTKLADIQRMGIPKPQEFSDIRKLLEDKSIDAISVA